jgi:glycosyltransferase involved in cell wall biosynthesis
MLVINARFLSQKISGVQRYAIELSKKLKIIAPGINFVAPRNIIHHALAEELEAERYGVLTGHLWEQIELLKYLKLNHDPLLLNFSGLSPLFYRNKITTIYDLAFLRHPEWFSYKYYYFYKTLLPWSIKHSIALVTISNFSKKEINEVLHVPMDKIHVAYCSIPEIFGKVSNEHTAEKRYVLTVSSIDPRKNINNLILAFNRLNINNLELIIIGSENNVFKKQDYKKLIQANNNIHFTGYLSDDELIRLYKNAILFIYPSFYEGFGIPPLEAMALGCPAIVSKTTSLPEVFGNAAYYIDPYDINDIANAIMEVSRNMNLRSDLISKGYERVKLFSWEKSASKIMELIIGLKADLSASYPFDGKTDQA